jgi:hypothetical protein
MVYGLNMGIKATEWDGRQEESRRFAFRCMAGGGRFGFVRTEGGMQVFTGWLRDMNRLHARLAPLRGKRTLLPRGRGVMWEHADGTQTLFAFTQFDLPVERNRAVFRVTGDGETPVAPGKGGLTVKPGQVYKMR